MANNYPILIGVILLLFLLYKEVKRTNKDRLVFRIIAVSLAVIALLFLVIPIKYSVKKSASPAELLLLSNGVKMSNLNFNETTYFTTDSSVLQLDRLRRIRYIPDLSYYLSEHEELNKVKVYGYGLKPEELESLGSHAYDFQPVPFPAGIISCAWPDQLKQTAMLTVQGVYNNTSAVPVKVVLGGLGSALDSVIIQAKTKSLFNLNTRPKQLGRAVYTLTALNTQSTHQQDTLASEEIPFEVVEASKIKVLVLSSFPDFEYKFLKNWFFDHQYPVVFRTRISKDKFSQDQLNTTNNKIDLNLKGVNASVITSGMLAKFDVVIADDEELATLNATETGSLRSAIQNGLGLLVRMNEVNAKSSFGRQFKYEVPSDSGSTSFSPILGASFTKLKAIPAIPLFYIQHQSAHQHLIGDKTGKTLLSTGLYGSGKIAASVVSSTYHWMLMGAADEYSLFWTYVTSDIARKEEVTTNWRVIPAFPELRQQTAIVFETTDKSGSDENINGNRANQAPSVSIAQTEVNLLQHHTLPFRWQGTFWPQLKGWNNLKINGKTGGYIFVDAPGSWASEKAAQLLTDNLSFAKKSVKSDGNQVNPSDIVEKEVSKWWFFALFLLAATFLWFETKML